VRGVQHYVIKFVSDLRQVGGFLSAPSVSSTNKTDRHDITIKQTIMIESLSKNKSVLYLDFYRGRRIQTSDMLMPFVNE
jgi:translation initiation factor IF-3